MKKTTEIRVSTHVARDFLQNAAYFNTVPKVVWEYVSNSLDNSKDGQPVNVVVDIISSTIRIADDGSGMSRKDLQNFFQMHGENRQRKKGKRVRGLFGTGKCAAFGIANCLRIDSTKNGKRNVVELMRSEIQAAKSGKPFPVKDVVVDEPTGQSDGTHVELSDFNLKNLDVRSTIAYIERHLSRYRSHAKVVINGQECQFEEPQASQQFRVLPPLEVAKHIGEVTLTIKVSPRPLEPETNGVDVLSHGIWHDTTLAGLEKREMSQYLFGEVDVPILEDKEWPIPPFDNTRNNALNIQNPIVAVLFGWIAQELEKVRLKLVEEERTRRQSEEAKRLQKEASKIAEILNKDFEEQQLEFEFARRIASRQGKVNTSETAIVGGELLPGGGDVQTQWQTAGHSHGKEAKKKGSLSSGDTPRAGRDLIPGSQNGSLQEPNQGSQKRRAGLFSIDYKNEKVASDRAHYDRDTRTIVINLDHPQIAGAYLSSGNNTETRSFREISFEVAVVEYAMAIPYEKMDKDEFYDAEEALREMRVTVNRVTRRFAEALAEPSHKNGN
jgi:hypothetical protein